MKKIRHIYILLFILFFVSNISLSQEETLKFTNNIYDKNIHTVLLHQDGNQLSYPILHLNSAEKLKLSFDDFSENIQDYYYTIVHCNSNWTESDLMQSEYINGFFDNKLDDYKFSFNTSRNYTHYNLIFPEENLIPTLSGNYIIKIFKNNNQEEIVLIKRFMILDQKVNIISNIKRATLINDRENKQEIDFTINHEGIYIADPYMDIDVIIKQNNRDDNSITNLQPLFVKQNQLIYDYQDLNTFYGNNEFRHFDIRSIRYQSDRIKEIGSDSNDININLYTDIGRAFEEFITIPDLNGDFIINKQEAWDSETEAEYVNVNFSLLENRKIKDGEIYLIGKFTDWKLSKENSLKFNNNTRRYETSILLKQGYYNYLYVLKENDNNTTSTSFIEGSHYQCNNEYYIYVYYREIGKSYDQLIGYIKNSTNALF